MAGIAGSLLVTLRADTDKMRADLDKATQKINEFSRNADTASGRVSGGFARMGLSAEKMGANFGKVVTGTLLMTGALEKFDGVGQVAGQTLGAFMVGGPLAAGITALAGGINLVGKSLSESGRKASEADATYRKWEEGLKEKAEKSRESIQKIGDEIEAVNRRILGMEATAATVATERRLTQLKNLIADAEARMKRDYPLIRIMDGNIPLDASGQPVGGDRRSANEIKLAQDLATLRQELATIQAEQAANAKLKERTEVLEGKRARPEWETQSGGQFQRVDGGLGGWMRIDAEQLKELKSINANLKNVGTLGR